MRTRKASALLAVVLLLTACSHATKPSPPPVSMGYIPADTNMSDSIAAPTRPLPPTDQTVSLTC